MDVTGTKVSFSPGHLSLFRKHQIDSGATLAGTLLYIVQGYWLWFLAGVAVPRYLYNVALN